MLAFSKAFDCINQDLLITKLNIYSLGTDASIFTLSYLAGKKKAKIKFPYSSFSYANLHRPYTKL